MRKAASLAAVLVVLASFATPSFAGRNQTQILQGNGFRVAITVPTEGQIGGTITTRVSITLDDIGNGPRTMFGYAVRIPGLNQERSAFRELPVGRTKTIVKDFQISDRAVAGDYDINVVVTANGDTKSGVFTVSLVK
jgi:hypothetical protein